ncbi:GNAT family acetyltransferase [uncultured Pseudomonas sp.]|uniref:GNAT family acetyltransferase n=1 Tax=uncultured Pseudomonas sp. TaxID=114707 RepID=UPI0025D24DE5|nr:GNAT family acetyltransferase [uncultured Pseudomonas sp.]
MHIRPFHPDDTEAVVSLWQICGLTRPWNDPHRDIQRKLAEQPELFLVGEVDSTLMASAMIGNDGHRGWLYYLAVAPEHRRRGHARRLVETAEHLLIERGCPKLHLMVRRENTAVTAFYAALGYAEVEAITLGKRLIDDEL